METTCERNEHSISYKIEQQTILETSLLFFSATDTFSKRKWEGNIPSLKIIDGLILSPSDLFSLFLNEENDQGIEIFFPTTPEKGDKLIITLLVSLPCRDKIKAIIFLEEIEVSAVDRLEMMVKDLHSEIKTLRVDLQKLREDHQRTDIDERRGRRYRHQSGFE